MPATSLNDFPLLSDYLRNVTKLSASEQRSIVEGAIQLLSGAYAHLILKQAMFAVDPVARLQLLRQKLTAANSPVPDAEFHSEILDIFISLRDLHTSYTLPLPYCSAIAFLPFYIESVSRNSAANSVSYVVSKVSPLLVSEAFCVGVEILDWNGVSIERIIALLAEQNAGSNAPARLERGIEAMTVKTSGFLCAT